MGHAGVKRSPRRARALPRGAVLWIWFPPVTMERMVTNAPVLTISRVEANGLQVNVTTAGEGPAVLLLHGWPHTWFVWRDVITELARTHRVIAPDLRGLGLTGTPGGGYDLHTLSDDAAALLTALGVQRAALVVGLDLGAPVAWMTAVRHGDRVERLAVMEGLLGRLPGAEGFLAAGPPWWFGFHTVPDLPEAALTGRSDAYIDWFLRAGTHERRGVDAELRDAFVAAYRDPAVLRAGFDHYRAMAHNAALVEEAAREPLALPVLALGGDTVGNALQHQLEPITRNLSGEIFPDCGHIIPADAPGLLVDRLAKLLEVPTTASAQAGR